MMASLGNQGYFWTLQPKGNSEQWTLWASFFFFFLVLPLSQLLVCPSLLEPSFHGHGTDISPSPVQVSCGLLDGVTFGVRGTGVTVVQENLTQVKDGGYACAVFLNVSLELLRGRRWALLKSLCTHGRTSVH